jgi:hypothetical protein
MSDEAPNPFVLIAQDVAYQSMRRDSRVWHEALSTAVEKAVLTIEPMIRSAASVPLLPFLTDRRTRND